MQITSMPDVYNSAGRNEMTQPWSIGCLHDCSMDAASLNNKICRAIVKSWDEQFGLVFAVTLSVPYIIVSDVVRFLPRCDVSRPAADNGNVLIIFASRVAVSVSDSRYEVCTLYTESTYGTRLSVRSWRLSARTADVFSRAWNCPFYVRILIYSCYTANVRHG
jgi:hypothetical protein